MAWQPILVVDENDQPLGEATMEEAHAKGLYHRIVRVMIEDRDGRILLQKRSPKVAVPNKWDHSAAGHVDAGETNEQAAMRETAEEIGLHDVELECVGSWPSNNDRAKGVQLNRFNFLFKGMVDSFVPTIQPSEVAEAKWYTLSEVKQLISDYPDQVTEGLEYVIRNHYS